MTTGKKIMQVYGNIWSSEFNIHNSKGKRGVYLKSEGKLANKRIRKNKIALEEAIEECEKEFEETMCYSCQYFKDKEGCPYYGEVDSMTDHREVNCKKFWP